MPAKPILPPPDDAPYHLKTFVWLMENSSAKELLSKEQLEDVAKAIKTKDEDYLKTVYPILLEYFVRQRNTNITLALQEEVLTHQFHNNLNEIKNEQRQRQTNRQQKVEAEDQAGADEILKQLLQMN